MSNSFPTLENAVSTFQADRRQPGSAPGSLRWVRGLVKRPLKLTRRDGALQFTLVDRRRPPDVIEAERLKQLRDALCEELPERLRSPGHQSVTLVMRHLGFVHHKLVRRGWKGVGALNSRLLGRALVQAQMLASHEVSPALLQLIRQLQELQAAAELREKRQTPVVNAAAAPTLEVSEASLDDYEATQRGWQDTVSSGP